MHITNRKFPPFTIILKLLLTFAETIIHHREVDTELFEKDQSGL